MEMYRLQILLTSWFRFILSYMYRYTENLIYIFKGLANIDMLIFNIIPKKMYKKEQKYKNM